MLFGIHLDTTEFKKKALNIFKLNAQTSFPSQITILAPRSDTHLYHRTLCVPFGDMLIHAGDFLAEWGHGENEFLDFLAWLKQLPHQKKMVTAGQDATRCKEVKTDPLMHQYKKWWYKL